MNWLSVKLSDVAPSKPLKVEGIDGEQDVWQVNLNQIESNTGKLLRREIQPYSMSGSSTHWFDERHVLYSKLRPYLNKVLLPSQRGVGTTELVPMLPDEKRLNRKFLAYYLRSKGFVDWISTQTAGAKMPRVSMKVFWEHKIPLPPLEEQKKIATILDAADRLRQKDAQLIARYNALSQSLFLDMFGDPVTNPMGWDKADSIKYCECIVPGRDKPKSFSGNVPWVTTNDLNHLATTECSKKNMGLSDSEVDEVRARVIPTNSVILTCVGDLGVVSINSKPIIVNQQLHTLQCDEINISPVFMMYAISYQKPYMDKMSSSTTVPYMNKTICNKIPMIYPPITLQNQFSQLIQAIEAQKQQAQASLKKSEELFNSLLQRAFKGELTQ